MMLIMTKIGMIFFSGELPYFLEKIPPVSKVIFLFQERTSFVATDLLLWGEMGKLKERQVESR